MQFNALLLTKLLVQNDNGRNRTNQKVQANEMEQIVHCKCKYSTCKSVFPQVNSAFITIQTCLRNTRQSG